MDIVDGLRAFVATAQTGSFTAGADRIGVSNRLTSKYVAELEAKLGVRLFQRTTRKVGLTPAGQDLLARAPAVLDELDDLLGNARQDAMGFTGVIRMSAPVTLGEIYLTGMLARFGAKHPNLTLDLRLDDGYVDLATDGIDVAFRIGTTRNLSLKVRKLGQIHNCVAASPDYLERRGVPQTPQDLTSHDCIIDTNRRNPYRWVFTHEGCEDVVGVSGRHQVNSARGAAELALAGCGIVYAPKFALGTGLETGALTSLMQEHLGDPSPINAVYLEGRVLPKKLRALIDFAHDDIRHASIF